MTPEGIPILIAERDDYLAAVGEDLTSPLDALSFEALTHLSVYLPQLLAPHAPLRRAVRRALFDFAPRQSQLAVELGCSIGPDLRTLGEVARDVIGVDLQVAAIRAANAQLRGEDVPLLERIEGRSFKTANPIRLAERDNIQVVVGNAMDPPLFANTADIVLAVNLIDSVSNPLALLGQMDALLRVGGLLVLTSPFAWRDSLTPPEEALGGGTFEPFVELGSAEALRRILEGRLPVSVPFSYEILRTEDVPWTLRDHARAMTHYDVHVLVAKKLAGLPVPDGPLLH
jgi:SAM-dependent methyltransferase